MPDPPRDQQDRLPSLAKVARAVRTANAKPASRLEHLQTSREEPVRDSLDHQLDLVAAARRAGHRIRAPLVGLAGNLDLEELARIELDWTIESQSQAMKSPAHSVVRRHGRGELGRPDHREQALGVVFRDLDLEIRQRVRAAEEGPAVLSLALGERVGRRLAEIHLAVGDEVLAARAVAVAAAVAERHSLAERRVQHGLAFGCLEARAARRQADATARHDSPRPRSPARASSR